MIIDFRFEYEYKIEYKISFSILVYEGSTLSCHIPISLYELPSLRKTNMKSEGLENATGLKFENCTHVS